MIRFANLLQAPTVSICQLVKTIAFVLYLFDIVEMNKSEKIKLMVVGFCSIGGWCYSGWWVWDLTTLAQFQGSKMFPGLCQDFMDGYIKPESSSH